VGDTCLGHGPTDARGPDAPPSPRRAPASCSRLRSISRHSSFDVKLSYNQRYNPRTVVTGGQQSSGAVSTPNGSSSTSPLRQSGGFVTGPCKRIASILARLVIAGIAVLGGTARAQSTPQACPASAKTFAANGAIQQWLVPAGVTFLTIDASGAQGGGAAFFGTVGGKGGRLVASFPVTPGEMLNVVVGGMGAATTLVARGGGGGGGSFAYRAATATGLLLAAGGGGGAADDNGIGGSSTMVASAGEGSGGGTGGAAGVGGNGGAGGTTGYFGTGAGGGGLLSNGGDDDITSGSGGRALANGAVGGVGESSGGFGGGGAADEGFSTGGGGGGGYNGGGGGGGGATSPADAGGGGASFVNSSGTILFAQSGVQAGDGQVNFCYSPSVAAIPTASNGGLAILIVALTSLAILQLRNNCRWARHQSRAESYQDPRRGGRTLKDKE
jgi:hypothetical protein